MSDPAAPPVTESTSQVLQALTQNLPGLMQSLNSQVLPQAQTQLNAAKQLSPAYDQLQTELYQQFAPQLAQIGSNIDSQTRKNTADTDVSLLQNQGAAISKAYTDIDKQTNPEYYKTRELEGNKLAELLGSINLNNANPEAERLINQENIRSGNTANPNATNTLSNALSFGKEMDNRRSQLSSAISQATSFLPNATNNQFNPATTILNKPTANTGQSQFGGVTKPDNTSYDVGQNFLQGITGMQNTSMNIDANRRDILDRLNETTSSV